MVQNANQNSLYFIKTIIKTIDLQISIGFEAIELSFNWGPICGLICPRPLGI